MNPADASVPMLDRLALVPATASDFEELLALRIRAMRPSLERLGRYDPERARERFAHGFAPEHTHHIERDGQRIGFVALKPHEGGLLLDHLYIDPPHQGQGVGAWVMSWVHDQADRAGLPVEVGALKGSDSNRFYLRHGFVQTRVGEWDNYYVRSHQRLDKQNPET